MSVWLAIPSKRPPEEAECVLREWRERGYRIALWRDKGDSCAGFGKGMVVLGEGGYPGYAAAVNFLCRFILRSDSHASWIVTGGDDVLPDPNCTAEEIAAELNAHFRIIDLSIAKGRSTFGVMQPTGDRWGEEEPINRQLFPSAPAYIDRICGSPWLGRAFCERMYGGQGPLCSEYSHMYVDEELQNVAQRLGVLWQRRDLTHYHKHWARVHGLVTDMPPFLQVANSQSAWRKAKATFEARKAGGFPGHEPLEMAA